MSLSEISQSEPRPFGPPLLDFTPIPIQNQEYFNTRIQFQEPVFSEFAICSFQEKDFPSIYAPSFTIEDLYCPILGSFGTARYVNPKQLQRILKIRQKRIQRGWNKIDRTKSQARKRCAMRRKRLANGQFTLELSSQINSDEVS